MTESLFRRASCFYLVLTACAAGLAIGGEAEDESFRKGLDKYNEGRYVEAARNILPAARAGHAKAMLLYAEMLEKGRGVAADPGEAATWYRRCADMDMPEAQTALARMFCEGRGVRQDFDEAWKLIKRAQKKDYGPAELLWGMMYEMGWGAEKDYTKALKWYRRAAEKGIAEAQYRMGYIYEDGLAGKADPAEALSQYKNAAAQGHAAAMFRLGRMFEEGRGTAKDPAEAARLYAKAAEAGDEQARARLAASSDAKKSGTDAAASAAPPDSQGKPTSSAGAGGTPPFPEPPSRAADFWPTVRSPGKTPWTGVSCPAPKAPGGISPARIAAGAGIAEAIAPSPSGLISAAAEGVRLLIGAASADAASALDAAWAPAALYSEAEASGYFRRLLPLMERFLAARGALAYVAERYDSIVADAVMAAREGRETDARIALAEAAVYKDMLLSLLVVLTEEAGKARELGNPPDPLAISASARLAHEDAVRIARWAASLPPETSARGSKEAAVAQRELAARFFRKCSEKLAEGNDISIDSARAAAVACLRSEAVRENRLADALREGAWGGSRPSAGRFFCAAMAARASDEIARVAECERRMRLALAVAGKLPPRDGGKLREEAARMAKSGEWSDADASRRLAASAWEKWSDWRDQAVARDPSGKGVKDPAIAGIEVLKAAADKPGFADGASPLAGIMYALRFSFAGAPEMPVQPADIMAACAAASSRGIESASALFDGIPSDGWPPDSKDAAAAFVKGKKISDATIAIRAAMIGAAAAAADAGQPSETDVKALIGKDTTVAIPPEEAKKYLEFSSALRSHNILAGDDLKKVEEWRRACAETAVAIEEKILPRLKAVAEKASRPDDQAAGAAARIAEAATRWKALGDAMRRCGDGSACPVRIARRVSEMTGGLALDDVLAQAREIAAAANKQPPSR